MGLFPGLVQGGWWAARPRTGGTSARGKEEQPGASCREGGPWMEGPQRWVSRAGERPGAQEREALADWPHGLTSSLLALLLLPPWGLLSSLRPCLLSELVLREGWCRWRTGGLTPLCPRWHPSLPWSRGAGGPRGWVGGLWLRPPASVWVPAATLGTRAVFSVIPHPCLCEVGLVTVLTPWGAGSLARQDTECQPRAGPRYVLSWPESPRLIVSCPSGWLLKERGPSGLALCPTHLQLTKGAEGQAWGIQTPRGTGPGAPEDRLQCREEAEPLVSVR